MTYLEPTLLGMDWHGAAPPWALPQALPPEGHPSATTPPLMMTGYPLIPLSLGSPFARGTGAEEIEVTGAVVTPMRLSPLEGGKRKRMDSLAKSKSPNLGARRVILMMWPMPLGSGPTVSLS